MLVCRFRRFLNQFGTMRFLHVDTMTCCTFFWSDWQEVSRRAAIGGKQHGNELQELHGILSKAGCVCLQPELALTCAKIQAWV